MSIFKRRSPTTTTTTNSDIEIDDNDSLLTQLPVELIRLVLDYVDDLDIVSLATTNRYLHRLTKLIAKDRFPRPDEYYRALTGPRISKLSLSTPNQSHENTTTTNMNELTIFMCGTVACGCSCSIIKFNSNHFVDAYDPTLEDTFSIPVIHEGEPTMLKIVNASGIPEYMTLRIDPFRKYTNVILMHSVLRTLHQFQNLYQEYLPYSNNGKRRVLLFVLNAMDITNSDEMLCTPEKFIAFSKLCNVPYVFTSAKTGEGLSEMFSFHLNVAKGYHMSRFGNSSVASSSSSSSSSKAKCLIM